MTEDIKKQSKNLLIVNSILTVIILVIMILERITLKGALAGLCLDYPLCLRIIVHPVFISFLPVLGILSLLKEKYIKDYAITLKLNSVIWGRITGF